jgi:hypothetical protein
MQKLQRIPPELSALPRYQDTRSAINTLRVRESLLAFQLQQQKRMDCEADEGFAINVDNERPG